MKAMILSDLLTVKKYFKSQALLYVVVVVAISLFMGNIYMIAPFLGVMMPFSLAFTLLAYDERNNWEQFRLVLPLSRKSIMTGRYASLALITVIGVVMGLLACGLILVVANLMPNVALFSDLMTNFSAQAIVLTAAVPFGIIAIMLSVTLPLTARFGMTKAVRYVPIFFLVIFMLIFVSSDLPGVDYSAILPVLNTFAGMLETIPGTLAIAGGIIGIAAVVYILSCMLSIKLYAKREF